MMKLLKCLMLFLVCPPLFAGPFIKDKLIDDKKPRHFRVLVKEDDEVMPVIGSGQFKLEWIREKIGELPQPLVIIDLRQEPHGFINGWPYTWYVGHDVENQFLPEALIELKERVWLSQIEARDAMRFTLTEREAVEKSGASYIRYPVQDHYPPKLEQTMTFLLALKKNHPDSWFYFHCRGGIGRTTTFLTLMDIMENKSSHSLKEILQRESDIGGKNFTTFFPKRGYKYPLEVWRYDFLKKFYEKWESTVSQEGAHKLKKSSQ